MKLTKKFLRNEDGNYAMIFAIMVVPLMSAVALSVDYSNLSRLKYDLSNSTDAMCSMVGREYVAGKTAAVLRTNADDFFDANFNQSYVGDTSTTLILPDDAGNTAKELKCKATLLYHPYFAPMMALFHGGTAGDYVTVIEEATMKMKNVAEIALVLDNSGSMAWDKYGNNASTANQRMTLLKTAAKKLVVDMITLGKKIHQTNDPVKFSVIPFAAAVNVGANNANASWMDTRGISPIHHEHLNWGLPLATNPTGFASVAADGAKLNASNQPLTRFSIYNALQWRSGGTEDTTKCEVWKTGATTSGSGNANCAVFKRNNTTNVNVTSAAAATAINNSSYNQAWAQSKYAWTGCVEARPNGYDITDQPPTAGNGASLFVPFFAPDDFNVSKYGIGGTPTAGYNNWWPDYETAVTFRGAGYWAAAADATQVTTTDPSNSTWWASTSRPREVDVAKYFVNKPYLSGQGNPTSTSGRIGQWQYYRGESGPNHSCTVKPILALSGTTTTVTAAIDAMGPNGNTNVPEGLAWGWRTISSGAPFTEGVAETRKDIDKVVIVLTDGANTYAELGQGNNGDMAGNKTTYATYGKTGYAGNAGLNGTATPSSATNIARMFANTTASKTTHNAENFQKAMDQKMLATCTNIKNSEVLLMTVALDLDPANYDVSEQPAIIKAVQTLTDCAGPSKTRKNADGTPKKLFWNATSDNLDDTFKEIADELSNLRFTN